MITVVYPWQTQKEFGSQCNWLTVQKAGAKHNTSDRQLIQEGHNLYAQLGARCAMRSPWQPTTHQILFPAKSGARHTGKEYDMIQRAHDVAHSLGAQCGGGGE